MDAAALLDQTLQPQQELIRDAQIKLEAAAAANFHGYMHTLANELGNEQQKPGIRQAAAIAFKNGIAHPSRDPTAQAPLSARWLSLTDDQTAPMKQQVLSALSSSAGPVGTGAAQCVAAIAQVEFPANRGMDLLQTLLNFAADQNNTKLRVHTLQAIGFICDGILPSVIASRSNDILTAVVQGARKEEVSPEVQAAALSALYNSLEFISDNFEREGERNYIMQVVCEATQSGTQRVQVLAYQNLVRIMSLYYDSMKFYMERALFGLTLNGMRSDDEAVALQAIEFWSTTCEEESERILEAKEAEEFGETPAELPHNFARTALPEIAPVLLQLLKTQDEMDGEDDWTRAMAAAACIALLAQVVGDDMVGSVVPYVESNIRLPDWQSREAAVMAFGSILDGPDTRTLAPLVGQILATLISMLGSDESSQVRDTVAWTISKITEIMLDQIDPDAHLDSLVGALCQSLSSPAPRVVTNCCAALGNIASVQADVSGEPQPTSVLSRYFTPVLAAILPVTQRQNNDGNCRSAAYQTISTFIAASADDSLEAVHNMVSEMLSRQEALQGVHAQLVSMEDRDNWNDMQINICVVLQSALHRAPSVVTPFADRIMTNLLQLISGAVKTAGVVEDAFATIGALASAVESNFQKYMDAFVPFLYQAFGTFEDWQSAQAGVFVISDISRALNEALVPYAERMMVTLVEVLRSPVMHRQVKPHAITAIGDVATAIGSAFAPYLETTMGILSQAGQIQSDPADPSSQEFAISMREGIIDAFAGILAGFKAGEAAPMGNYVGGIMQFIKSVWESEDKSDHFTGSSLGLIGDFGEAFGANVKEPLQQEWVQTMIRTGRQRTSSKSTRNNAAYAQKVVGGLI